MHECDIQPIAVAAKEFWLLAPEIILSIGAVFAMLLGAAMQRFWRSDPVQKEERILRYVNRLLIFTITISLCVSISYENILLIEGTADIFNGTLVGSYISYYARILILVGLMGCLLIKSPKMPFEVPILLSLSTVGMMLTIMSNDLITLYLGLELTAIPIYGALSYLKTRQITLEVTLKYFIFSTAISLVYLVGASMIFASTGTTSISVIQQELIIAKESITEPNWVFDFRIMFMVIGIALILITLCAKLSAAPFHFWAPDIYQYSPIVVAAVINSVAKISVYALLIRLVIGQFSTLNSSIKAIVGTMAILSMIIGSLGGLLQKSFRRMLGYSSIGHLGFILLGLLANEPEGPVATIIYIVLYSIPAVLPPFIVLSCLDEKNDLQIEELSSIRYKSQFLALALGVSMLSLAGLPPFSIFFAKLNIISVLIMHEMYATAFLALAASIISAIYYMRVIKHLYFYDGAMELEFSGLTSAKIALLVAFLLIACLYPLFGSTLDRIVMHLVLI